MLGLVINILGAKESGSNLLWIFQGRLRKKNSWVKVCNLYIIAYDMYNTTGYEGWHGLELLFTCLQVLLPWQDTYAKVISRSF